jgi:transporter family-2 protein
MKLIMTGWALAIGLLVPLQAIINSKLSANIGGSTQAALISFTGGFLIFALVGIFNYANLPSLATVMKQPPMLLSGGIIGAVFVLSAIIIVPKLGSTSWIALIVTGQLISSMILDHYGMLGLDVKLITLQKVLGAVLLLIGSFMVIGN